MYNIIFFIIIAFLILNFVSEQWVSYLNAKCFGKPIPSILKGIYDEEKYQKQQAYSKENYRFSLLSSSVSMLIIFIALFVGFFGWLDTYLRLYISNEVFLPLVFFAVLYVINEIIDTPFEYYQTFAIEDKYGFNKTTKKIFISDKFKNLLLSAVIGGVLLGLIVWFYTLIPDYFWLLAWLVISLFTIFILMFYSEWIVPMFNKQTPLEEGDLRTKIEEFATKAGFTIKNIYVIDGSKRSTKANAYFSGLGSKKRIVLYDTLIKELSSEEIVAVLAHEIGHYTKKHTLSMLFVSLLSNLFMLWLLGFFLANPLLSQAMGGSEPSFHLGLLAFGILYTPISVLLGLAVNAFSRKHEYQADAYAKSFDLSQALISALKKLSETSLSNLQPHKAYVFMHYSHPTLLQRIEALQS